MTIVVGGKNDCNTKFMCHYLVGGLLDKLTSVAFIVTLLK